MCVRNAIAQTIKAWRFVASIVSFVVVIASAITLGVAELYVSEMNERKNTSHSHNDTPFFT